MKVIEAQAPEPIPEGLYLAKVADITEGVGEYGEYLRFVFEITDGEYIGITRNEIASKKLSKTRSGKTSKLYGFVKSLTGREPEPGSVVDIAGLIDKPCQILVKDDKEVEGIMYQRIESVLPPQK